MPRLRNELSDKERTASCVMTANSVVYKVSLGAEKEKLGHFIEAEDDGKGNLTFRYAVKKEPSEQIFRIDRKPEGFKVSFD
jgi:hypothetical protein